MIHTDEISTREKAMYTNHVLGCIHHPLHHEPYSSWWRGILSLLKKN